VPASLATMYKCKVVSLYLLYTAVVIFFKYCYFLLYSVIIFGLLLLLRAFFFLVILLWRLCPMALPGCAVWFLPMMPLFAPVTICTLCYRITFCCVPEKKKSLSEKWREKKTIWTRLVQKWLCIAILHLDVWPSMWRMTNDQSLTAGLFSHVSAERGVRFSVFTLNLTS